MRITPLLLLSLFGSSYCAVLSHEARDEGLTSRSGHSVARAILDPDFKTIFILPNRRFAENLAVRSNGKILVTTLGFPEIWQVDPEDSTGELLFTFPKGVEFGNNTLGITEYRPDIFAIVLGNWSLSNLTGEGIQKDFMEKIGDIPPAVFLNGLTSLAPDDNPQFLLVSDSYLGVIYRVNVFDGTWDIFLDDPSLKRNPSATFQLGVNGIRYYDGFLYFVNSSKAPMLARVPVSKDFKATGPVQVIAAAATFPVMPNYFGYDNFAFDTLGRVWLATNPSKTIVRIVPKSGEQYVQAGGLNDETVSHCTSLQFSRFNASNLYFAFNYVGASGKILVADAGFDI